MNNGRRGKVLTLVDSITLAKLKRDIEYTLEKAPLQFHAIVIAFSDRLPPNTLFYRKDRFFDAVLQKMRKEGRIESVKGRWQIVSK